MARVGAKLRIHLAFALGLAAGFAPQSAKAQSALSATQSSQTSQVPTVLPADTLGVGKSPADSLTKAPKSRSDSVIVVKHHFDHREQIITGSVIMTCLALMMVAMNNYNPR